ncbi:MAG: NAD(P)-dependent oxidoreductase [Coriobacteriia bacterium]|nr:NAD(P)-dependent oxidoreductase [Coriobacteriia bacterium]
MRVLVTGAAGFVGSAVCRCASARGDEVHALVRPGRPYDAHPGVSYRELDWSSDVGSLTTAVDEVRADIVVHCAGATPRATSDLVALYDANVRLVWTLSTAIKNASTEPSAVILSSAAVYGPSPPIPTHETAPLAAGSHYAWSKVLAEEVVRAFVRTEQARICIARPFNLLGGGEPAGSVVSDVVDQLEEVPSRPTVRLRETGSVRDYVDVDDAAAALLLLAAHGAPGGAYNVCTGRGISIGDLVQTILDVWGSNACVEVLNPSAQATVSVGSPDKIRGLGWEPSATLWASLEASLRARKQT